MKKIITFSIFILTICSCNKSVKIDSIKKKGVVINKHFGEHGTQYIFGIQTPNDIVEEQVSKTIWENVLLYDSIK